MDTTSVGEFAVDRVTGFGGTINAICFYQDGLIQVELQPHTNDKGELPKSQWFSSGRVQIPHRDNDG